MRWRQVLAGVVVCLPGCGEPPEASPAVSGGEGSVPMREPVAAHGDDGGREGTGPMRVQTPPTDEIQPRATAAEPTTQLGLAPQDARAPTGAASPAARPRVEVHSTMGPGECDIDLRITGLPAIRDDGGVIVFEAGDASDLGDHPPVFVVGVSTVDESEVFRHAFRGETVGLDEGTKACRSQIDALREHATALDRQLAPHGWRALEPLPVVLLDADDAPEVEGLALHERPVVVQHRHGQLIAKIPGHEVLMRHPAPWRFDPGWDPVLRFNPRDLCRRTPSLETLHYDRITRSALVVISFNEADLCQHDGHEPHVVELPQALIDACDRRAVP